MKATDEKILLLKEPPVNELRNWRQKVGLNCNRQQMKDYAQALTPWLESFSRMVKVTADGLITDATEMEGLFRSNASEGTLTNGLALFMSHQENLKAYIDSLSTDMKTLWQTMLRDIVVDKDTAKDILHTRKPLFKNTDSYSFYFSRKDIKWEKTECKWFDINYYISSNIRTYGYRKSEGFITIRRFIHTVFLPVFFPNLENTGTGPAELDSNEWRIFDFERESLMRYHLFSGLIEQGELPFKKTGIGIHDVKRVQKSLMLNEFFPADDNEYRHNLRAYSYIKMLALYNHVKSRQNKLPVKYEDTLRDLFKNLGKLDDYLPAMLYPHIKGLRKQFTEYGRHVKLGNIMLDLLKKEAVDAPGHWVDIDDLLVKTNVLDPSYNCGLRYTVQVFNPDNEQSSFDIENQYHNRIVSVDEYVKEFGLAGLHAYAFILCSLGIVQLATTVNIGDGVSPFDSARYVRLTALGRYVVEADSKYNAPEYEHVAYFELDHDRLIIRSLVDPNPYAQMLLDTSRPISRNRYETSALSFLENCHKREDVEEKISIFQRFIASELPPLWKQFFESLLQHCHPLKEDKTIYLRYTIDPNNRELISLITTDEKIRQIVTRAEGFMILVKLKDLQLFETLMKKHGYLL